MRVKPIASQTVEAGKPLTVVVFLENADASKEKLHYTLAGQVPPGATIDAERGVFLWTPTANQAAGEYDVTVSVGGPGGRSDQTSFAVKVTPSLHASASAEPPTIPLADLPLLEETGVTWSPAGDARSTSIHAAREKVLQGLEEKSWDSLLDAILPPHMRHVRPRRTGPGDPQQPTDIPERFILTGRLSALRVSEGKSLVFIEPDQNTLQPMKSPDRDRSLFNNQLSMMNWGGIGLCAAVEFEGETLGWTMSDYKVGDAIRVAVQRLTNKKLEPLQPGQRPRFTPGPYGNMALTLPGIMDELRWMRSAGAFFPGLGRSDSNMSCWCFRGQGLEKTGQTETWIDARLGRAGTMAADVIRRSPGFLMRTARISKGTSGRLIAKIDQIGRFGQDLAACLTVPDTVEGPIRCIAHFGSTAQTAEFLDYRPGAMVEVAATVDDPLSDTRYTASSMYGGMPPFRDRDPQLPPALPTLWTFLPLNCSQIRIQGQPATLVDARGPRRTNLALSPPTPEVAQAALNKVQGQEATWSGKLHRVRCRKGETHLVVSIPKSILGISSFEAYADDSAFVKELADYVDSQDSFKDAEEVSVTGTVCPPNASRIRLQGGTPLLKIKQVDSSEGPQAHAVVGVKRRSTQFPKRHTTPHRACGLNPRPSPGRDRSQVHGPLFVVQRF